MSKINKKTLINIFILLLFMVLTFVVCLHHEPWMDEAQSWLIARDASFLEIINLSKYEGTPALWFYILKILNIFHFPYEYINLVPWFFGCIGIALLLFTSKLPAFIKYLFPFTFYPFFQYSIVARNHSLFFPLLAVIAVFYTARFKHPYLYSILLILLGCVSAYGFVIAFILFAFLGFEMLKEYRLNFKKYIPLIIALLSFISIALLTSKPDDCTFTANFDLNRLNNPLRVGYIMLRGFFNSATNTSMLILQGLTVIALYVSTANAFCKSKRQLVFFISLNLILGIFLTILYCKEWHSGYLICTLVFTCWVLADENYPLEIYVKRNKIFYLVTSFILLTHLLWSVKCSLFDIKYNYSGSKEAANFIIENNLQEQQIIALGYHTVALQPYFDKNQFVNFDTSYWKWDKNFEEKYLKHNNKLAPVIIIDEKNSFLYTEIINIYLKDYKKNTFTGALYAKGEFKETTAFSIYVYDNKEKE